MLIRFGVLIVASISLYAIKQITVNSLKSKSPLSKTTDTAEESFRYCKDGERKKNKLKGSIYTSGKEEVEEEEEEGVFRISDSINTNDLPGETNSKARTNIKNGDSEVECLRYLVCDLETTQEKLERQLFAYYGLHKQEMEIVELKNDLEMKTAETNRLRVAIKSLQTENKKLQEEIRQSVMAKNELERAKAKIKELQKNIQIHNHPINRHSITMLGEQVANFRTDESLENDGRIQAKLKAGRRLELEVMELKRRCKELQLEKRVLSIKLAIAEARITAFSTMTESKIIEKLEVEADASRRVNEDLLKQVDELQKNRFDVVEEVVYQRWINACLRHEIQGYQTPRKSSTSDVESVSSPKSSPESKEFYNFSEDTSSSGKTQIRQKTSLIHKLKRWRNSFDGSSVGSSLRKSFGRSSKSSPSSESSMSRRSSFSAGSFGASTLKNLRDGVAVPTVEKGTTNSPKFRRRRVSFNDSLNTVIPAEEKSTTGSRNTESVERRRRRVSLSDLLRSTSVIDDKYPNYGDRRKIVFELQRPIKENDEVRTEVIAKGSITLGTTSEMGESTTPSLEQTSTEENTNGSMKTRQIVSKIEPTDHIEERAPVMPRSPDINITDTISTFFLMVVFLYLFLRYVSLL